MCNYFRNTFQQMGVNFSERLRATRLKARYTSTEMANIIGVSKRTYDYYEAGKNLDNEEKLKKYSAILDEFEKNILHNNAQKHFNNRLDDKTEAKTNEKQVPYYDIDAIAGNVTIFQEDGAEYIKDYISVPAFQDCEMFINVSGSSMYPKYVSGELIALKKITDFEVVAYGEAYLIVTREQRLLKYIKKSEHKNMWSLHSEHEGYEPFDIHIAKVLHLYIVKGKITKNII